MGFKADAPRPQQPHLEPILEEQSDVEPTRHGDLGPVYIAKETKD